MTEPISYLYAPYALFSKYPLRDSLDAEAHYASDASVVVDRKERSEITTEALLRFVAYVSWRRGMSATVNLGGRVVTINTREAPGAYGHSEAEAASAAQAFQDVVFSEGFTPAMDTLVRLQRVTAVALREHISEPPLVDNDNREVLT